MWKNVVAVVVGAFLFSTFSQARMNATEVSKTHATVVCGTGIHGSSEFVAFEDAHRNLNYQLMNESGIEAKGIERASDGSIMDAREGTIRGEWKASQPTITKMRVVDQGEPKVVISVCVAVSKA